MDKISLNRLQLLHPKVRDEAISTFEVASKALTGRAFPRVTETLRSYATSNAYYAQGRTKPGKIITNAGAGYSWHNFGFAFDFALVVDKVTTSWSVDADYDGDLISDWMEVVKIMKAAGWLWGGNFKKIYDAPHFEKTFGLTTAICREKVAKKDFIPGTNYIKI